jgi:hypothetical protein
MSSYRQNIAMFDKKGDIFLIAAVRTVEVCWQHFVTVHKIIIGGTMNVLNYI